MATIMNDDMIALEQMAAGAQSVSKSQAISNSAMVASHRESLPLRLHQSAQMSDGPRASPLTTVNAPD